MIETVIERPLGMTGREQRETVTVERFFAASWERLRLQIVTGHGGLTREIPEVALTRPGLALAGFFEHFDPKRLQVIGSHEYAYLLTVRKKERAKRLTEFFMQEIPGIVLCRDLPVTDEMRSLSEQHGIPILSTSMETHYFINTATFILEELFRPHVTVYGTMMDVYGEGVMLSGEPGVGKSETALGLLKRGHALISDDNTMLRRDRIGQIMASSLPPISNFMEIRGIGIIHVPSIFGITATRGQKELDLVLSLQRPLAGDAQDIDRTGESRSYRSVLGLRVPEIVIVVAAGRDVVNLVETAVCEFKLRSVGLPSAQRLDRLIIERRERDMEAAAAQT
jgi:HPr kinase/phosphorylase